KVCKVLTDDIGEFFEKLIIKYDKNSNYKKMIESAIKQFLVVESPYNAKHVYTSFFEIYPIFKGSESNIYSEYDNTLINIVNTLRKYEESTGSLINKQRDHYIHAVNVFLLGLSIYINNSNYRKAFKEFILSNKHYFVYDGQTNSNNTNGNEITKDKLSKDKINREEINTDNINFYEEFFFRWGIASLFHDIGYPLEIIGKQLEKFINDSVNVVSDNFEVSTSIDFKNFHKLHTITKLNSDFGKDYREDPVNIEKTIINNANFLDSFKSLDLITNRLLIAFDDLELNTLKHSLDNFILTMAENGFIDHGFYSAILVLLVYGNLIQKENMNKKKTDYSLFFFPIVDSASAILLHNYYRNVLWNPEEDEKKPFCRGPLSVNEHPLGYLLILCDELQEWSRKAFGIQDKKRFHVDDCELDISDDSLEITYLFQSGLVTKDFVEEKIKLVTGVLKIDEIFSKDFIIKPKNENVDPLSIYTTIDLKIPNQLIRTIEEIAKRTYYYYRANYKDFRELEDNRKYYCFKRAQSLNPELNSIGYEIVPETDVRESITKFSDHELNNLAKIQHNAIVKQIDNVSWIYFPKNWFAKKENLHLKPGKNSSVHCSIMKALDFLNYFQCWDDLRIEYQETDKELLEDIHKILGYIDLKIVKTCLREVAIKTHNLYNEEIKKKRKFHQLPLITQYSNYKLAYVLPSLLKSTMGYGIVSVKDKRKEITNFTDEEQYILAKSLHEIWAFEVKSDGWKYDDGSKYDDKTMLIKKINKNIVPWEELDKELQKLNKKTVSQLPVFLKEIDLMIVKKE
ncbi:MAG: hypothetical protein FWH29_04920, partial [Methanobrevibacter sp.]|nr:hypothetical protein [Methanobrevibacter sp.]